MRFEPFEAKDLSYIEEFQPPNWGDLHPRFSSFLMSPHCQPIKLVVQNTTVAIGTNINHEDSAWLACIITHPEHRNKGYGQLITRQLIDNIDRNRYSTIYLEATDMGFPVYLKLGFEIETLYDHYKRADTDPAALAENIYAYEPSFRKDLLQLDYDVSGENRLNSLEAHLEKASLYLADGSLKGYYLPTLMDGHIIATTVSAGTTLMQQRISERAFATVPRENEAGQTFLLNNGFDYLRTSRRMFLGKKRPVAFERIYNRVSGQLG